MGKKEHAPSAYRKIIKGSKSDNANINKLIEEARALSDPYYISLALFNLSVYSRLGNKLASQLKTEALNLVEKEKRPWRRAELIISLCKLSKDMPKEIIKQIEQIPEPKAKAEAISGAAKHLGCKNAPELLKLAIQNEGHEVDSCKPIIKFWATECPKFEMIMEILDKVNHENQIKLLGYLQLQLARAGTEATEPIEKAVELALKQSETLATLKYLASQSNDIESLEAIAMAITDLPTPLEEASLLTTLAGSADRAGQKELALDWFNSAQECLNEVKDLAETASIRFNLAMGFKRLGQDELAEHNFQLALENADNDKLKFRIQKAMGQVTEEKSQPVIQKSTRNVLALHDTYEGNLSPIHIRMIARAAPLCIAYGLDLALLDFPVKDLDSLVKKVSGDTNIGKGGRYLKELAQENRILLINEPDEAGLAIATTSHPDNKKKINLEKAMELAKNHSKKRLCVIMGLGRKGLPKYLLASVDYHAEITGSNVPLETSTAMGIIAQQMGSLK
ncbi:MAG: DUF531 family protein [Thermoplasmata archaeon]|nr:DUF531 family protein [Thermoplasmata archaeon]